VTRGTLGDYHRQTNFTVESDARPELFLRLEEESREKEKGNTIS